MREINKVEELEEVLNGKKVIALKFGASWCQPCKNVDATLQELNDELPYVEFIKTDIEHVTDLCLKYGVRAVPTVALFQNGKLIDRRIGQGTKQDYVNLIEKGFK